MAGHRRPSRAALARGAQTVVHSRAATRRAIVDAGRARAGCRGRGRTVDAPGGRGTRRPRGRVDLLARTEQGRAAPARVRAGHGGGRAAPARPVAVAGAARRARGPDARDLEQAPGRGADLLGRAPTGPTVAVFTEWMFTLLKPVGIPDKVIAYLGDLFGLYVGRRFAFEESLGAASSTPRACRPSSSLRWSRTTCGRCPRTVSVHQAGRGPDLRERPGRPLRFRGRPADPRPADVRHQATPLSPEWYHSRAPASASAAAARAGAAAAGLGARPLSRGL